MRFVVASCLVGQLRFVCVNSIISSVKQVALPAVHIVSGSKVRERTLAVFHFATLVPHVIVPIFSTSVRLAFHIKAWSSSTICRKRCGQRLFGGRGGNPMHGLSKVPTRAQNLSVSTRTWDSVSMSSPQTPQRRAARLRHGKQSRENAPGTPCKDSASRKLWSHVRNCMASCMASDGSTSFSSSP